MSENKSVKKSPATRRGAFEEASRRAPELLRQQFVTHTKEEMAERLTTYTPGVPHFWFGRPVAPITKEELLAYWNGGPEIEPRYLDVEEPTPAKSEEASAK